MKAERPDVLIVGAGPTGLMRRIELAQRAVQPSWEALESHLDALCRLLIVQSDGEL